MTFQDEFVRRLRVVRGEAAGDGGEDARDKSVRLERSRETGGGKDVSRLRSTRTGGGGGELETQTRHSNERNHPNPSFEKEGLKKEEQTRHPELVSGSRPSKSEVGGKWEEVLK